MSNLTVAVQENAKRVSEINTASLGCLDTVINNNVVISEERVNSDAVGLVGSHVIGNLVRYKSLISVVFLSDVIGKFGLVEVRFSVVTVPDKHVSKSMLNSESITSYVVSVDLKASIAGVPAVVHQALGIVIGSPEPHIINNSVAGVNLDHLVSLDVTRYVGSSNSGKNVAQNDGVLRISGVTRFTNFQERVSGTGTGLEEDTGDSYTVDVCDFNCSSSISRDESSKTKTEDNCVWVVDLDGVLKMINSGLENEVESF